MSSPTRGIILALAFAAIFLCAGCSSDGGGGGACTEIGCTDQLTIRPVAFNDEVIKIVQGSLIIDGESIDINCATTPNDATVSCTAEGLVIRTSSTDVVVKSLSSGDLAASDVTLTPVYAAVRPNGAGCEPVCQQAVVDLKLGGGLTDAPGSDVGADVVATDAGQADAGTEDAGAADAGQADAGTEDAGAADAGTKDAGAADSGVTDAGVTDAGVTDAGVTDAGVTDAGAPDGGAFDTSAADTTPTAPGCCKAASDCPKGNTCVGSVCKDPSLLKSGECWHDADCKSGACSGAKVCPCGAMCFAADKPGLCPAAITCSTINPTGYGMCDMHLGVGWDGKKCVNVSGCGCKEDCAKIFKTKADCEAACTKQP